MERNYFFDFIRGIAIIMVIAIHTYTNSDLNNLQGEIYTIIRQIFNCAVPIFFAISGYFLASKNLYDKDHLLDFWRLQIPKVYTPVLFWSFPFLILDLIKCKSLSCLFLGIIKYFTCSYSIYYFIAVIIQFYILLPLLLKLRNNITKLIILAFLISFISVFVSIYYIQVNGLDIPLIILAGHADFWIIFFIIGIFLRYSSRNYSLIYPIFFVFFTLGLQYVECSYLYGFHGGGFGVKPSSFLFSLSMIFLLFNKRLENYYNERSKLILLIRKIGNLSFGIYLTHCFFISIIHNIPFKFSWFVEWLIILSISFVFVKIGNYIFPKKINKFIGFC